MLKHLKGYILVAILILVTVVAFGGSFMPAHGAALTADRDTVLRSGDLLYTPVLNSVTIYAGAMTCGDDNGYAQPCSSGMHLHPLGRAEALADNSSGSDGDINVTVRYGIFKWGNSSGALEITLGDIGHHAYMVDDQTVAKTANGGTRYVAGHVQDVDSDGMVWVDMTHPFAADLITGDLIAVGAVNSSHILNSTIQSNDILNGTILNADIATGAVNSGSIEDASVSLGDLDSGIAPGFLVMIANTSVSENDSDAEIVIVHTGVLATDIGWAILNSSAVDQYVTSVATTTNTITVTLGGNGGAGTTVNYMITRAAQ